MRDRGGCCSLGTSGIHGNGYFYLAERIWAGSCNTIPSELPGLRSGPTQQLWNEEQKTWKDENYAKESEPQIN